MNQWNKWIPQILIHCEPQKQLQLVKGWLDGDGHYRKSGNSPRYKGTTVSNQLCEGVKNILYRNFVNPSITTEIRPQKAKVYNINFNGALAAEFKDAIDNNRPVIIDETMRLGEYYPLKYGDKLYMRNKVRKVKILPPDDEDVYCLQMEMISSVLMALKDIIVVLSLNPSLQFSHSSSNACLCRAPNASSARPIRIRVRKLQRKN